MKVTSTNKMKTERRPNVGVRQTDRKTKKKEKYSCVASMKLHLDREQ